MNVTPRAIPTLAFVLLAALATACGVDGGGSEAAPDTTVASATTVDEPSTTTSEPESTTTEPESTTTKPDAPTTTEPAGPTTTKPNSVDPGLGDLPPEYQDQVLAGMTEAFVEAGLTQEQAQCLADTYGRDVLGGSDLDMGDAAGMLKYFTDCGVDPNDL